MATHQDYLKARDLALKLRERVQKQPGDREARIVLAALSNAIGADPGSEAQATVLALSSQAEETLAP